MKFILGISIFLTALGVLLLLIGSGMQAGFDDSGASSAMGFGIVTLVLGVVLGFVWLIKRPMRS